MEVDVSPTGGNGPRSALKLNAVKSSVLFAGTASHATWALTRRCNVFQVPGVLRLPSSISRERDRILPLHAHDATRTRRDASRARVDAVRWRCCGHIMTAYISNICRLILLYDDLVKFEFFKYEFRFLMF